ncbi:MAG: hypothetical protein ACLTSX_05160 [Collinsella sp.]
MRWPAIASSSRCSSNRPRPSISSRETSSEQIAQAAVLQKARIAACQEQLVELASAAGALDKRMEACEAELQRFLGREE